MNPDGRPRRISRGFIAALVALAAAAAALFFYSSRLTATDAGDDGSYIPAAITPTEEVRLLQQYVQLDTQNPPGNESRGARLLHDYLKGHGIQSEIIESAPGRGSIYARIEGESEGNALLLLHHIDVAPVDPSRWTEPPFSGSLRRNLLWGRGTLDMKGIGIAHLAAFVQVAKAKRPPKHDLVFLGVADEEMGGRFGMEWLVRNRPDVVEGVNFVFNEGGSTDVVRDKLIHYGIEIGSKQVVRLRLTSPERETLREARFALEPYFEPSKPHRILPGVQQYLASIAPTRRAGGELLRDLQATVDAGKFWLLDSAFRALTTNYVTMSGIREDEKGFAATVTLANLPDEDPAARVAWARDVLADVDVEIEPLVMMGPAPLSSTDTDLYRLVAGMVRRQHGAATGVGPLVSAFVTNDCRFLRSETLHCYGVAPFLVDYFHTRGIHGVDEQLRLDWFVEGVELMKSIVSAYCFGE